MRRIGPFIAPQYLPVGYTMAGRDFAPAAIRQVTTPAFILDPDGNNIEAVFRDS